MNKNKGRISECYYCDEIKEIPITLCKGKIRIDICEKCYTNNENAIKNEFFNHNKT